MQVGFLALLDVLGFSSLVSGDEHGGRLQRYLDCVNKSLCEGVRGHEVDYVVFSDSIVLTTRESSMEASLQALVLRCSRLLGLMLENEVAMRGAIAYGSYL